MDAPYQRLAATLRHRITSGDWAPGTRIPSGQKLREEYNLGRGVVEYAMRQLRSEGLVEGKPGAPATVAYYPPPRTLIAPDADWPYPHGDKPRLSRPRASADMASRLRIPEGTLLYMERVDLLDPDNRPAMLLTTWRRGIRLRPHSSYRCEVDPLHVITREEAAVLGLSAGTPAMRLERTRYDDAAVPVEAADLVLPVDRWRIGW